MKDKMEKKDIMDICEQAENYSDSELKQIIAYLGGLLIKRHASDIAYEDEFIQVMLKCGLDEFSAEMALLDFKTVSAAYISKAKPLFIEDVEQVLEMVLSKSGYTLNMEAKNMLHTFSMNSFGKNIPSI